MKFQLHVTAMIMLSRCGEQFRRRYIEGEKLPPKTFLAVGTGVDRSVRSDLQSQIENDYLLPGEQIADIARDATVSALADGFELDGEEEAAMGPEKAKAAAVDKSVRLATLHHGELAPVLRPHQVARQFVLDLQGHPFELAGEIDITETDGTIRDTKTAKKTPAKNVADNSSQLTSYSLAQWKLDGSTPPRVALDFLIDLKRGPKSLPIYSERKEPDFPPFLERVGRAVEAVQKGIFIPADPTTPGTWWCSERFCGYWGTCPYVRRR